jgi:hypothetical protein
VLNFWWLSTDRTIVEHHCFDDARIKKSEVILSLSQGKATGKRVNMMAGKQGTGKQGMGKQGTAAQGSDRQDPTGKAVQKEK